jgi:two-component system phosphate regulon response regulator OmpR
MSALAASTATADTGMGAHILVVDDDKRIRSLLSRFLAKEGYLVSAAGNADEAMLRLRDLTFDLIVLDVMMPGESGTRFAAQLRRREEPLRSAPILMLTALKETKDRVEGLEAGVDDYLAKPFEPRELSLRIASILRRTRAARRVLSSVKMACFGDFSFDLDRGELCRGDSPVRLTTREREILRLLTRCEHEIVSRSLLARREERTGQKLHASERSVDVEIARLRRKIESDPTSPRHLQTVRGQGYRLLAERIRNEMEIGISR